MATRYAVASGNWSNVATWDGGVALPGVNDEVYANGKTVTIDQNATVISISTNAKSPAAAGGGFILSGGITITANILTGTTTTLTCSANSPDICGIIGNIIHDFNVNYITTVAKTGTCILNIVGDIKYTCPGSQYLSILNITGVGIVNITGNAETINSIYTSNHAIGCTTNATINFTGNIYGGSGGGYNYGISLTGGGTLNFIGNVYGGVSSSNNNYGIAIGISAASNVTINGNIYASSSCPAIFSASSAAIVTVNGNLINIAGMSAFSGYKLYFGIATTRLTAQTFAGSDRSLYSADTLPGVPAANNVRKDTIYGAGNELTGTLAVPPAASVGIGVPVDDTVGTGIISAEGVRDAVWGALLADLNEAGSIGARLKNAATVASTGDQIAAMNP